MMKGVKLWIMKGHSYLMKH